jgi:hypothetical protein
MHGPDEAAELPAIFLRLVLLLAGLPLLAAALAAQPKPDQRAGAAMPIVGSGLPIALAEIKCCKVVDADLRVGMFRPENVLTRFERALEERFRLRAAARVVAVHRGEIVDGDQRQRMIRPQGLLIGGQNPPMQAFRVA